MGHDHDGVDLGLVRNPCSHPGDSKLDLDPNPTPISPPDGSETFLTRLFVRVEPIERRRSFV